MIIVTGAAGFIGSNVVKALNARGVTDIVADDALSAAERAERGSYVGCIAGALSVSEFRDGLEAAGLAGVSITPTHVVADGMSSAIIRAVKPADAVAPAGSTGRDLPVAEDVCCGGSGCS